MKKGDTGLPDSRIRRMIDTHTHIYEEEFSGDLPETVSRAGSAGVVKFVFPSIDSSSYDRMMTAAGYLEGMAFCGMGLHPTSVDAGWERELDFVRKRLDERRWIAVGEIGLDGHWSTEFMEQQRLVFHEQMTAAFDRGLPVIIHVRDATEELLEELNALKKAGKMPRGVFHAFSGSYETYRRLKRYGDFLFGIGGVVTYKNAQVADAVSKIPVEDLVLETDAPYLTPVPFRGRRNEPAYLTYISQKIADLKGMAVEEVRSRTTMNAERLFRFEEYG